MDNLKVKGQLLNCKAKAYDFQGTKGTSYKATVMVGSEVFKVKTSEAVYEECKDLVNEVGSLNFAITSFNLTPAFLLVEFKKD